MRPKCNTQFLTMVIQMAIPLLLLLLLLLHLPHHAQQISYKARTSCCIFVEIVPMPSGLADNSHVSIPSGIPSDYILRLHLVEHSPLSILNAPHTSYTCYQANCHKGNFFFPPILLMLVEKYVHKSISVSKNSAQSDDDDDDTCIVSSCDLII